MVCWEKSSIYNRCSYEINWNHPWFCRAHLTPYGWRASVATWRLGWWRWVQLFGSPKRWNGAMCCLRCQGIKRYYILKKKNISIDVNHPDVISSLNHKQLSNHPDAADSVLGCPTDQLEYVTSLFLTGDASQLLQAIASGSNIAPIPWTHIPSGKHTKD